MMGVRSFVSVDPITALHMGLSSDKAVVDRAQMLADVIKGLHSRGSHAGERNLHVHPLPLSTLHDLGDHRQKEPPLVTLGHRPPTSHDNDSRVVLQLKSFTKLSHAPKPQQNTREMPSFEQIFLGQDRLSTRYLPSAEDSALVMVRIQAAGFDCSEDFVTFLQTIAPEGNSAERYRQVRCLCEMGIGIGHARKVIMLFDALDSWDDVSS